MLKFFTTNESHILHASGDGDIWLSGENLLAIALWSKEGVLIITSLRVEPYDG